MSAEPADLRRRSIIFIRIEPARMAPRPTWKGDLKLSSRMISKE